MRGSFVTGASSSPKLPQRRREPRFDGNNQSNRGDISVCDDYNLVHHDYNLVHDVRNLVVHDYNLVHDVRNLVDLVYNMGLRRLQFGRPRLQISPRWQQIARPRPDQDRTWQQSRSRTPHERQEAMKKPPRSPSPNLAHNLAAAAGISKRTLTRWFAHGILGPAPRRGPGVGYSDEQMLRARAASRLRLDTADLDAISRRLDSATRAELEAWARGELAPPSPPPLPAPSPPPSSPPAIDPSPSAAPYPATRYEHIELAPGLTLLVRADCDPAVRRLAQDIYAGYGPSRR
jgi:hypothetical protein